MNATATPDQGDACKTCGRDLPPRARSVGVVAWCSFLTASAATMLTFAFVDPTVLPQGVLPSWLSTAHAVYAVGFFFFWGVCAVSAALTIYMAHTEHAPSAQ